jgi:hypothetical protein
MTLNSTPRAPSMETSSSGLSIACWAAWIARFSPLARPIPMRAEPALLMTALTSAKSRLIRPLTVIRSEIPWTPWRRTSSATLKASSNGVSRLMVCSRRSFGMTISVSTVRRIFSMASSALRRRFSPSNANGLVAKPTTNILSSRATSATMWPAPLPVPPPAPSVMKTMSAPSMANLISSRDSTAAFSPMAGSAPAPRPRVASLPMWILVPALEWCKRLGVSIDDDEFDTLDTGLNHAVDSRAAGAAHTDHFDACECFDFWLNCLWHENSYPFNNIVQYTAYGYLRQPPLPEGLARHDPKTGHAAGPKSTGRCADWWCKTCRRTQFVSEQLPQLQR